MIKICRIPQENQSGFVFKIWKPSSCVSHFDRVTPEINQVCGFKLTPLPGRLENLDLSAQPEDWFAQLEILHTTEEQSQNHVLIAVVPKIKLQMTKSKVQLKGAVETMTATPPWHDGVKSDSPATGYLAQLEKICSGILWGTSSLARCLCSKIDQRSEGWWRFGSKRAQNQAHKKPENSAIQISSLEGTKI